MTTMNDAPLGYMPIPTAEQLAEALAKVRCFHDLSAELIAPELLANLLAALSHGRENVREWIPASERLPADSRDVLVYCSDTDEYMVGSSMGCGRFAFAFSEHGTRICCKPSHWRYIDECDKPAALAASTGQEVGK